MDGSCCTPDIFMLKARQACSRLFRPLSFVLSGTSAQEDLNIKKDNKFLFPIPHSLAWQLHVAINAYILCCFEEPRLYKHKITLDDKKMKTIHYNAAFI